MMHISEELRQADDTGTPVDALVDVLLVLLEVGLDVGRGPALHDAHQMRPMGFANLGRQALISSYSVHFKRNNN